MSEDENFSIPQFLKRSTDLKEAPDREPFIKRMGISLKALGVATAVGVVGVAVYGAEGGFAPLPKSVASLAKSVASLPKSVDSLPKSVDSMNVPEKADEPPRVALATKFATQVRPAPTPVAQPSATAAPLATPTVDSLMATADAAPSQIDVPAPLKAAAELAPVFVQSAPLAPASPQIVAPTPLKTVVAELAPGLVQSAPLAPASPQIVAPTPLKTVTELAPVIAQNAPLASTLPVQGMDATEIRFGMAAPFSGANRESGTQLKVGVEIAFNQANDAGGVNGRKLRLLAGDDGYEPGRTLGVVRDLYEKKDVFGFICDFGSATAEVAVPYALDHKALYFGALSGASVVRRDPPDRYVFNFRPSYAEETMAALRYLTRVRRISPKEIAVFQQEDAFGEAGFAGVAKAMRNLPDAPANILKLTYKRNTIDVADAARTLVASRGRIKAVIMVATFRAAAKFIEKTRDSLPDMIYTNVSAVGATSLSDELKLLGPSYADGVIVTQVTPDVSGASSTVLKYKTALEKYSPGLAPDYTSFEAYIDANILIDALRRAGKNFDSEKLVDTLESMHELDIGLGGALRFSDNDHQASHKVWGTRLNAKGAYQPIDLE